MDRLELVQHPEHMLRRGHHVRGRDILDRAYVLGDLANPAPADLLLLVGAEVVRIADHAPLSPSQRDVHHRALPCHPHGQSANGVHRLLGMEADAALAWPPGVVVLHTESAEHFDASVVHAGGNREGILPQRFAEELNSPGIELQKLRDAVELGLGHLEGVIGSVAFRHLPGVLLSSSFGSI